MSFQNIWTLQFFFEGFINLLNCNFVLHFDDDTWTKFVSFPRLYFWRVNFVRREIVSQSPLPLSWRTTHCRPIATADLKKKTDKNEQDICTLRWKQRAEVYTSIKLDLQYEIQVTLSSTDIRTAGAVYGPLIASAKFRVPSYVLLKALSSFWIIYHSLIYQTLRPHFTTQLINQQSQTVLKTF